MLETRVVSDYNFLITLDKSSPYYRNLYMIMRSLLAAYEDADGNWVLDFDDFCVLKHKLDQSGLMEGRKANQEAIKLLQFYQEIDKVNEAAKGGAYNDKVLQLLDGKLKTTPYSDQLSGIAYLLKNPRSLLMDAMGTGKSLQSLAVSAAVAKENDKTLVIAPNSVLMDFEKEVSLHTYFKPITIPSGKKKAYEFLKKNVKGDWDVLLVHPENLIGYKEALESDLVKILINIPFRTILIDEFHLYKNTEAKRSQVLERMLKVIKNADGRPARVHPMTGTLVSESPLNAYFALQIAGKGNLPSVVKFEKYFTIKKDIPIKRMDPRSGRTYTIEVPKVVGFKNLELLKSRLDRCSIRRTKEDLEGFPLKTVQTRTVILTGKQRTLYKDLSKGVKDSLKDRDDLDTFFSTNNAGIRLVQLLNHPNLIGEDAKSAKYEAVENILEEVLSDPEQKIILWTEYRAAVDLIYDIWNKQYGVIKLYGGVKVDKDLEKKFVHDKGFRIAAAIPKKAGTGVDFLARARTSVFIDHPRSYKDEQQAIDRIHRRVTASENKTWLDEHRSKPCTIIFLEAKDTVDEYISEKMKEKDCMSKKSTPSISKKKLLKLLR